MSMSSFEGAWMLEAYVLKGRKWILGFKEYYLKGKSGKVGEDGDGLQK